MTKASVAGQQKIRKKNSASEVIGRCVSGIGEDAGAHRVTKLNETNSCEIKCVAFSRMIYQDAHWNMKRSYRLAGKSFLEQNLVSFPISDAIPIENGKMLDEAVSPTVAPRRAEASPSQNNPSSAVKADRGAV